CGEILEIDDCVLELEELLAPVLQVVHLVAGLLLDQVLLAGRRDIEQHHAAAHPLLEVDVLLELHVGPEVHELDTVVGRADAVNTPEALDDAHRVPVDVVVDQPVAVLEVLAFGNAVGGDQQVEVAFGGEFLGPLFGAWREGGEDRREIAPQLGQRRLVAAGAGDEGALKAKIRLGPGRELLVEVAGGVRKSSEHDDLAVLTIDRVTALVRDDFAEGGELGVAFSGDLAGRADHGCQTIAILNEILLPAHEVHVLQQHLDLAADQQALEGRILDVHVVDVDLLQILRLGLNASKRRLHVLELPLDGQRERDDRAFHPLEDVHTQEVNQALFAVHLPEETRAPLHLGAVL